MAEAPVTLIPLLCVRCQSPIAANPGEVAWVCGQCRQGLILDEVRGLQPLEIHYHTAIAPNALGNPYWVVNGAVSLNRQVYGGGDQTGEAERFWAGQRQFIIPAYSCSAQQLASTGTRLLLQPPALQAGTPTAFIPVTLAASDLAAAAQFLIMTIEAGRKDRLKSVNISINLGMPALWILPT
jgi:hypothetical protein